MNFIKNKTNVRMILLSAVIFTSFLLSGCTREYLPTYFSWSGGSNKVNISCSKVTVKNGESFAEISFDSPYYEYVIIDGKKIYGDHDEESSTFTVPIVMDEDCTLIGMTTAMSEPHEIEYVIHVSILEDAVVQNTNEDIHIQGENETKAIYPYGEKGEETISEIPEENMGREGDTDTASGLAIFTVPELSGLQFDHAMDPRHAECFNVYYYSEGYKVLDVPMGGRYLIVPEGGRIPEKLPGDMSVINAAPDNIYVAATSAMSLFNALESLDHVKFTGTNVDGWNIDAPKVALQDGSMTFAGKYSEPDYELLTSKKCEVAVESTMIFHAPQIKEMLEELGIPVFVDRSSYEGEPLGRTEWIRLYGAMMNKEELADELFKVQEENYKVSEQYKDTGKTVAIFSLRPDGSVRIRVSDDYIIYMLKAAGGKYVFDGSEPEGNKKEVYQISMEEFYSKAADADYLVYNATNGDDITTKKELLEKDGLFEDFKAFKEGNVWKCDKRLYQSTDIVTMLTSDFHTMLTVEDATGMTFMRKLE